MPYRRCDAGRPARRTPPTARTPNACTHPTQQAPAFDRSTGLGRWTSFTGFNLNIGGGSESLAPIFTLGRYLRRGGRAMLPLAIQIDHAAADGFHVSRLVRELQDLLADPRWVV